MVNTIACVVSYAITKSADINNFQTILARPYPKLGLIVIVSVSEVIILRVFSVGFFACSVFRQDSGVCLFCFVPEIFCWVGIFVMCLFYIVLRYFSFNMTIF